MKLITSLHWWKPCMQLYSVNLLSFMISSPYKFSYQYKFTFFPHLIWSIQIHFLELLHSSNSVPEPNNWGIIILAYSSHNSLGSLLSLVLKYCCTNEAPKVQMPRWNDNIHKYNYPPFHKTRQVGNCRCMCTAIFSESCKIYCEQNALCTCAIQLEIILKSDLTSYCACAMTLTYTWNILQDSQSSVQLSQCSALVMQSEANQC